MMMMTIALLLGTVSAALHMKLGLKRVWSPVKMRNGAIVAWIDDNGDWQYLKDSEYEWKPVDGSKNTYRWESKNQEANTCVTDSVLSELLTEARVRKDIKADIEAENREAGVTKVITEELTSGSMSPVTKLTNAQDLVTRAETDQMDRNAEDLKNFLSVYNAGHLIRHYRSVQDIFLKNRRILEDNLGKGNVGISHAIFRAAKRYTITKMQEFLETVAAECQFKSAVDEVAKTLVNIHRVKTKQHICEKGKEAFCNILKDCFIIRDDAAMGKYCAAVYKAAGGTE